MLFLIFSLIRLLLLLPTDGQMIGGEEADPVAFSYQVAIVKEDNTIHCGGGIIGSEFILTAAHCVIDVDGDFLQEILTAVIGTVDLNDQCELAIRIPVHKIYVTKEYKKPNVGHYGFSYSSKGDIAVLKLRSPIIMDHESKLKILEIPTDFYEKYEDEVAAIAGYGFNEVTVEKHPQTHASIQRGKSDGKLRSAEAKVLTNDECEEVMPVVIHDSHVCARIEQYDDIPQGVCSGDSGGPLVLDGKTVIGVLSFGAVECNEEEGAAVYTRTNRYQNFIEKAMEDEKIWNMRRAIWYFSDDEEPTLIED